MYCKILSINKIYWVQSNYQLMITSTKTNRKGAPQQTDKKIKSEKKQRPKTSKKETPHKQMKRQISSRANIYQPRFTQIPTADRDSVSDSELNGSKDESAKNIVKICEDPKKVAIKFRTSLANGDLKVINILIEKNNWEKVTNKQDCEILWINYISEQIALEYQRSIISRIPGIKELSNKKQTSYYLTKSAEYFPGQFYFYPKTYVMPEDFREFYRTFRNNPKKLYIAKPDKGTQGAGIFIVKDIAQLFYNECLDMKFCKNFLIIQEYVQNPYLLDEKKFDLRLYVLITSLKPFIVYLNDEGLARFCTENYQSPNLKNANNAYMHLTNYHLNKNSSKFIPQTKDFQNENTASKRTYTSLKKSLRQKGLNLETLKQEIEAIILRFLYSMLPRLLYNYREVYQDHWQSAKSFHILGFDILLDSNLKPYILEVNASPSLDIVQEVVDENGDKQNEISQLDLYVKQRVVEDALLLAMKESDEQINLIGRGRYFNSYKMISDGSAPEQNIDIFEKMSYLYGHLCGRKFGPLSSTKFQKMVTLCGIVNRELIKSDYDLIFKKVTNSDKANELDFKRFIDAIELIARKYYQVEKTDVSSLMNLIDKALQNFNNHQYTQMSQ